MDNDYLEVPISVGFDRYTVIGTAKILKSALPEKPDWVLSLGFRYLNSKATCYELKEFSMISDDNYKGYLEQKWI